MVLCKVCSELGLRFGCNKDKAKAILAKEKVTKTTEEQLREALDCAEEEHDAILFIYRSDKKRYGGCSKRWRMMSCRRKTLSQIPWVTCATSSQDGKNTTISQTGSQMQMMELTSRPKVNHKRKEKEKTRK